MFQHDLKGVLAYSTISHLGLITLLLGLNSPLAAVAAVFHIMNHATFKASLFMAAGIVDHETGTRDIRRLSGLLRAMPHHRRRWRSSPARRWPACRCSTASCRRRCSSPRRCSCRRSRGSNAALPFAATLAGVFAWSTRCASATTSSSARRRPTCRAQPHEPPRWMRVPVELLVLACLVVGVAPARSIGPLLAAAARPVVGGELPDVQPGRVARLQPAAGDEPAWRWLAASLVYLAAAPAAARRADSARAPLLARLDGKRAVREHAGAAHARSAGAACARSARGACRRRCLRWSWRLAARGARDRAASRSAGAIGRACRCRRRSCCCGSSAWSAPSARPCRRSSTGWSRSR